MQMYVSTHGDIGNCCANRYAELYYLLQSPDVPCRDLMADFDLLGKANLTVLPQLSFSWHNSLAGHQHVVFGMYLDQLIHNVTISRRRQPAASHRRPFESYGR